MILRRCCSPKPRIATGHGEARRQSLHVPLERARMGLVEVVQAEHDVPIRTAEEPEVRQVRITAQLGVETGPRTVGEIRRHQVRRTTEEREGRDEHPAVADRHEVGHAGLRLLLEELDRIRPVGERLPARVRGAGHFGPGGLAPRRALVHREVLHPL